MLLDMLNLIHIRFNVIKGLLNKLYK